MNLKLPEETDNTRIIVVENESGNIGIIVNEVTKVITLQGDQIDDMTQRITDAQELLELRRDFLNRKFLAMERAVSQFQAQMAQLNAMTSAFG